jgi:hypothetical protein
VPLAGLPAELDGLRVVQISDLHLGPLFRAGSARRIVTLANACHPDVVVLTGDFVNYRAIKYLPAGVRELTGLQAPLGVFACLGNHDHWEDAEAVRKALEAVGVRVLVNESTPVAQGLSIAAVDDLMSGRPDLERAMAGLTDDGAVVLLSHNPTILPKVADRAWLVLSGHTHGGQIALPFLGPRGTARLPGVGSFEYYYEWIGVRARHGRTDAISTYRYPEGWYREGRARMYVSRGVGFSQGMPIRLNCPPEIACFTLRAAQP